MSYGSYKVYRSAGSSSVEVQHDVKGCRARWSTRDGMPTMAELQEMVDEHEGTCLFY